VLSFSEIMIYSIYMIQTISSSKISESRRKGFTLVELLVVMFIIATLAAIASTWAYKVYKRSKVSAKTLQYQQLFSANEGYVAENGGAICPAKSEHGTYTQLLAPYLTSEKKDFHDPFFRDYDEDKPFINGIGMAFKHLEPVSNTKNNWNTAEEATPISMSEITFPGRRILMGDSSNWFLNEAKMDTTRHEEEDKSNDNGDYIEKGMFLFFDGTVKLLEKADAVKGLTDPESLEF